MTSQPHTVLGCTGCGVAFLAQPPLIDYSSAEYRNAYNDSAEVEDYRRRHDALQLENLYHMRHHSLRDAVVADYGCGGGSLLDFLHGVARTTIAVEPFVGFHHTLRASGHVVFSTPQDMVRSDCPPVDLALSLQVIEHVDDPADYLRSIAHTLAPQGRLIVATPNLEELLLKLGLPDYESFYFRTAHRWYFTRYSLRLIGEAAGLTEVACRFIQTYDISNAFCWIRDARPTGNGRLPLFDARLDAAWKEFLIAQGVADTLWMEFVLEENKG